MRLFLIINKKKHNKILFKQHTFSILQAIINLKKYKNMQTFILLTKLSSEVTENLENRDEIGAKWLEEVKQKCPKVKFLDHYALLGRYDFLDIYEAPDAETAAKVSLISRKNGAMSAESLSAIPYKDYLEITKEL